MYGFSAFVTWIGGDSLLHLHHFPSFSSSHCRCHSSFLSPINSSSSFLHLCYFIPSPSGVGLFQETNQLSVPLGAPVVVLLGPSEEAPPSPGAAIPEGEALLQPMTNLKCVSVILIHSLMCVRVFILQVCANLGDMCVVFAGPLPAGFSEREVRRLFCCCGPVRKIKMLTTAVRVYLTYIKILWFNLMISVCLFLSHQLLNTS